ncbi:MAG: nitrous oxide-stimulated promoter family protein [Leptothrix sp. (in: Bacteria)]|nr:nitrous oxide-stimulated promoter family protein [Leptothrix sp. (in: b-proteobacteria)]
MDSEPAPPLSEGGARRAARLQTPRLQREQATMVAMLRLYCRDHHGGEAADAEGLCPGCAELLAYSRKRLAACPFGPEKPTCSNCQIHCYGPRQREETRVVMRYAGPRMLLRHPILAIAHLVDGRRPAPPKPRGTVAAPVNAREGGVGGLAEKTRD